MRPRLVHIINDLSRGGAEHTLLRTARSLVSHFDQTVVCLLGGGPLEGEFRAAGIPVEIIGMTPGPMAPMGFVRLVRRLRALEPRLVQTWLYHSDLVGGVAAWLAARVPVIWNLRSSDLSSASPATTKIAIRACALLSAVLPSRILACSQVAADSHTAAGYRAPIEVVSNGVDLERFQPDDDVRSATRAAWGIEPHTPVVGLVARVHRVKNHELFVEAARIALTVRPELRFVLAGTGADQENRWLTSLLRHAGLKDATLLLGEQRDMHRVYPALDLVTLVSRSEGFPNVLAEAQACGIACVSTPVGAAPEILAEGGIIVGSAPQSIATAWLDALAKEQRAEDRNAGRATRRAHIERHFDHLQCVGRYRAIYDSLMNGRR